MHRAIIDDFDENILDENGALDCTLLVDTENKGSNNQGRDCLGLVLVVVTPTSLIWFL